MSDLICLFTLPLWDRDACWVMCCVCVIVLLNVATVSYLQRISKTGRSLFVHLQRSTKILLPHSSIFSQCAPIDLWLCEHECCNKLIKTHCYVDSKGLIVAIITPKPQLVRNQPAAIEDVLGEIRVFQMTTGRFNCQAGNVNDWKGSYTMFPKPDNHNCCAVTITSQSSRIRDRYGPDRQKFAWKPDLGKASFSILTHN